MRQGWILEVDLSMAKQRSKLMEYLAKRSRYDKLCKEFPHGFELHQPFGETSLGDYIAMERRKRTI